MISRPTPKLLPILLLAAGGCVHLNPGDALTTSVPPEPEMRSGAGSGAVPSPGSGTFDLYLLRQIAAQAEFEHGCSASRVRLVRHLMAPGPSRDVLGEPLAFDLDVCGVVRRYERVSAMAWLDVTSLFPASSLPAPLPSVKEEVPPGSPEGRRTGEEPPPASTQGQRQEGPDPTR